MALHRDSDKIKLQRGVRQGDNISPKLFTACLQDAIINKINWEDKGINIDGEHLSHLIFADDIQKRAIRLLFGAGRLDHTTPLFQRANILKFTDLVKLKTAVFMYKAYHCMLPENIQRNFVKKDIMHQTRTKQQLVRLCVSSNVRSMSLCVYGITLWNALRTDIKSKNSVNAFKQSYKKYIISEYE